MKKNQRLVILSFSLFSFMVSAKELVVYTSRSENLVKPIFELYEKKTGIKISYQNDKDQPLIMRLKTEGALSPADVLITVDAGNLWYAAENNLLETIKSKTLEQKIPANLRDSKNRWFGLSVRARTIIFNPQKVKAEQLSTYEQLADSSWKSKLCLRSSKKVYNQSLIAMMFKNLGEAKTSQTLKGWVSNLGVPVTADDDEVIKLVASGNSCVVGIVNSYYVGRALKKDPNLNVRLFWPNQKDRGVHVNVSGAGVVKTSKQKKLAQEFVEWLASDEIQTLFGSLNLEFPANPKISVDPLMKLWGSFKQDQTSLEEAGKLQAKAIQLADDAGYL